MPLPHWLREKKGIADLDLARVGVEIIETGAADRIAMSSVADHEGAPRCERAVKVGLKNLAFPPVRIGVLHPYQRVAGHDQKFLKLILPKWRQDDAVVLENW